jgi:hypothetical protein
MTADRDRWCFAYPLKSSSFQRSYPSPQSLPHKNKNRFDQRSWPLFCIFSSQNICFPRMVQDRAFSRLHMSSRTNYQQRLFSTRVMCGSLSLKHDLGLSYSSLQPRFLRVQPRTCTLLCRGGNGAEESSMPSPELME